MPSRVLFFGDSHLDPAEPAGIEAFAAFAGAATGAGYGAVYCLGDLFHYWVGPAQARLPGMDSVLSAMRELASAGAACHFLAGNRDFHLDRRFLAGLGWALLPDGHRLSLDGAVVELMHGDLLCTRDLSYRAMRAVLRSLPAMLLVRALPLRWRLALAGGLRGVSSRKVQRLNHGAGRGAGLVMQAVRQRMQAGAGVLLCGHLHAACHESVPFGEDGGQAGGQDGRAGELYVLPGWEDGPAWLEYAGGEFRFGTGLPV